MRSFNSKKIHQITNYYAIDCWLKIELKRGDEWEEEEEMSGE